MKIFILTILMGAILGSASYSTTLADTSVGVGFSASNFATDRGLAVRDDSLGYSLNLTAPAADGNLSIGLGLYDTDGSSEDTDFSIAYSKDRNWSYL